MQRIADELQKNRLSRFRTSSRSCEIATVKAPLVDTSFDLAVDALAGSPERASASRRQDGRGRQFSIGGPELRGIYDKTQIRLTFFNQCIGSKCGTSKQ
ncbi:hypothetical protein [Paraburkholderia aspalathi]|uniref:hypothetical protein n=1 Tax=Paraburkholderia aspalathi TaxID=1324617 RepID=UPI001160DB43|nr:hypothetical protein [Paraburkholderia aspalathi]